MKLFFKQSNYFKKNEKNSGFVAIFAVLVSAVVLAITLGISSVSFKEITLTSQARDSNFAFFAADTGIECALYHDLNQGAFVNPPGTITCANQTSSVSSSTSLHSFYLDTSNSCANVTINKGYVDSLGVPTTLIESKGYNKNCAEVQASISSVLNSRVVERSIRVTYASQIPSGTGGGGTGGGGTGGGGTGGGNTGGGLGSGGIGTGNNPGEVGGLGIESPPSSCPTLLVNSSTFSSSVNPTGNPVGGGACYTQFVLRSSADVVVSNKSELISALGSATSGDVLYIEDTAVIDLTGVENLMIPDGVTLASGRGQNNSKGALLYSNSLYPNALYVATLLAGENVRITGLRMRGPSPEPLDHDYSRGVANGIRALRDGLEVDNCELWAWNKWAVWLYKADNAYIHHNYIHHTMLQGYGYTIWVGGAGNTSLTETIVEANLFEGCRHCIGSTGSPISWEARYNVLLRKQFFLSFDRHILIDPDLGGYNTTLKNNLFLASQQHFDFSYPFSTPSPGGMIRIVNNWFSRDDCSPGAGQISEVWRGEGSCADPRPGVVMSNNHFSGSGRTLPTASINASITQGTAPLSVQFSSSGSVDNEGGTIVRRMWRFGDGDFTGNQSFAENPTYTFTQPGIYEVALNVFNEYGIPSDTVTKIITVLPQVGTHVVSVWVKETYPDTLSGHYIKQLLLDGEVIWEDDVAGDEGWQHVVVDISDRVTVGETKRIAMRLYTENGVSDPVNEIIELILWVDDFQIFGTDSKNSGFENLPLSWKQAFAYPNNPPSDPTYVSAMGSGTTTANTRSGELSWRFQIGTLKKTSDGLYAEVYQNVVIE